MLSPPRRSFRHLLFVPAVVIALAGLEAQQPQPTFRSGVEVVRIDVSVVDNTGRPVNDLTAADFSVTVDRKPRTIVSAQFLKYEIGTKTAKEHAPAQATPPTAPAAQAPPPPRIVLIVIDEDHIESVEGLAIRQQVARFLDLLAPNDRVGVVTIPRLREEVTLSTRRSDVMKSLDAVITGLNEDVYEFSIGTAEAFAVERGEADVARQMVDRNCGKGDPDCSVRVMMVARQVALQAHLRGQRSLDALASLAEGLTGVEGSKTVLLVSGGLPMPDLHSLAAFDKLESTFAAAQISLYTLYLEWSPFGRPRYRPSPTAVLDIREESWGLENATSVVGGTLMQGIGTLEQYFDRIVTELSGSYLLGVEVTAADRDGRTHSVDVKVNRRGVDVRARKRYLIEPERQARAEAAPPKPAAANTTKVVVEEPPPPDPSESLAPEVQTAVDRAGVYAAAYETALSGLVAEERYIQRESKYEKTEIMNAPDRLRQRMVFTQEAEWVPDGQRTLKSDFLLVKAHGSDRWMPFRDVYEVDGKAVREREQRLQNLFLEAPATAAERAAEITAESARYNIGFVERNLNLPTLALRYLDPARRAKLAFRRQGQATIGGVKTWELAFAERGSPTVVRDGTRDVPATGSLWIDPATGRVVRSTMRLKLGAVSAEVTVTYRSEARAGDTLVPAEMREVYLGASRRLECVATYSNVRRFQVTTSEVQKDRRDGPSGLR